MTIRKILEWLLRNGYIFSFRGNENTEITGFASLASCELGKITWVKKKENYDALSDISGISFAVVESNLLLDIPNQILTENSKEVFFAILHHFWGSNKQSGFIGQGTVIGRDVIVDPTAYIGYNCTIIGQVTIGAHTIIENSVCISGNVVIGERCHIQSGVVIGEDGFGYSKNPVTKKKTMVEHFGGVQIGNDVFIGSHVNIARGTIDDTIISDGVKIAPSTHIGHNNLIGDDATVICSNLFGSARIGKDAYVVSSTIQNQSEVGEHTVIGMGSIVTKPIPANMVAFGIPAKVIKDNNTNL